MKYALQIIKNTRQLCEEAETCCANLFVYLTKTFTAFALAFSRLTQCTKIRIC